MPEAGPDLERLCPFEQVMKKAGVIWWGDFLSRLSKGFLTPDGASDEVIKAMKLDSNKAVDFGWCVFSSTSGCVLGSFSRILFSRLTLA